ncbi:MAG TPA: type III-B CRISPR module RAMP protein Cmr4 [Micromonosporaceae bacterium]
MQRALLFLYAESPVHAGADSSLGALDLPIQREASTSLPVIWGQSLKGALRDHLTRLWTGPEVDAVFGARPPGSDGTGDGLKPGTLSVGDAQLIGFPVPTLINTYAWLSGPLPLGRLRRKAELAGVTGAPNAELPTRRLSGALCLAAHQRWAAPKTALGPYVLPCDTHDAVTAWADWLARTALPGGAAHSYFRGKLTTDLVVVGDDLLAPITKECAEVTPRVQLGREDEDGNRTKTVAHGPFYSEYLPTETILAGLLECRDAGHLDKLRAALDGQILRLGGDETIGKGLLWCRLVQPSEASR